MGRRRKKTVRYVKKTLPEQYLCPKCGMNTIQVNIDKENQNAIIICSSCNLHSKIYMNQNMTAIDAYCQFVDYYYDGSE